MSMGVYAGGNSYGIDQDIMYSFPIVCEGGDWKVVDGLEISEFSRKMMSATEAELVGERDAISDLL